MCRWNSEQFDPPLAKAHPCICTVTQTPTQIGDYGALNCYSRAIACLVGLSHQPPNHALQEVRPQYTDEGEISVALGIIKAVSHNEHVRYYKAHEIRCHLLGPPRRFVQQNARSQGARAQAPKSVLNSRQCPAGVEYVIHKQDIAPFDLEPQRFRVNETPGLRPIAVARNANKIQTQRQTQVSQKICQEHHRAGEYSHNEKVLSDIFARYRPCQFGNASAQLRFGYQHFAEY